MTMATVHQINVSDGGVPKLPVNRVTIDANGVSGDRQADLRNHGGPDKAVCLYSLEVIEGFQAEGHAIAPGSAGENLTIRGLDWSSVVPGARLRIGEVVLEIVFQAVPCSKNAQWFSDRDFRRMDYERNPGKSRMYARVIAPGTVSEGDPVDLM
jgi:MOSC domain-containing protein YiiM